MTRNVRILRDRVFTQLGIASERARHQAFQWRLPPSESGGTDGFWNGLASRFRPQARDWIFGMTSMSEQVYCDWYADKLYTGQGKIVELGTWLGSLTLAIAGGLRRNPRVPNGEAIFHSYDLFRWHHSSDNAVKGTNLEGLFKDDDDFFPLYLEVIKPAADLVVPHKADLLTAQWKDGPIEFLLVDSMKYEPLVRNIQQQFFAAVLPGRGILMHQDFMHFYESWIHVSMYQLRDCFVPICALPDAASVIFRCRKEPRPRQLDFPDSVNALPVELIEEAYTWVLKFVPEEQRDKIAAAHTMMYVHRADLDTARRLLERYQIKGPYGRSAEFKMMHAYLKEDRGLILQ